PTETPTPVAMISPQEREFRKKLKELRDHLTANADNVGKKFPEQARKMHYGEIEHRSIYGEASPQDAKELHEEGIEFHPLPVLPDERNSLSAASSVPPDQQNHADPDHRHADTFARAGWLLEDERRD